MRAFPHVVMPQALDAARRLYAPDASSEARRDALAELRVCGEPTAIPLAVEWLLDEERSVAEEALRTVLHLGRRIGPYELPPLDRLLRRERAPIGDRGSRWGALDRDRAIRLVRVAGSAPFIVGLVSCHRSGYVREAAVELLNSMSGGVELPFLLLRLDDGVQQVRSAAKGAVEARLRADNSAHFVRDLALVLRLGAGAHADLEPLRERILELVRGSAAGRQALLRAARASDPNVRRPAWELMLLDSVAPSRALVEEAVGSDDVVVARWAAQTARRVLSDTDVAELLPAMARHPFLVLRRDAVEIAAERSLPNLRASLLRAAMDTAAGVREIARYHLRALVEGAFRTLYAEALTTTEGEALAAAVAGLGETGEPADAELLAPFVRYPRTRVAREAVRAVARLDGDGHAAALQEALRSNSAKVSAEARRALLPRVHLAGRDWLWRVFREEGRRHVRRNALALVAATGKWQSIPLLVRACADPEPELAAFAADQVAVWLAHYNRGFAVPTPAQLAELSDALQSAGGGLPPDARAELGGILDDRRRMGGAGR